jgi:hypothetical protein
VTELRTPYRTNPREPSSGRGAGDHTPQPTNQETLAPDEYRLIKRLRQLKAKRADIAVVVFNPGGMKVRELGE